MTFHLDNETGEILPRLRYTFLKVLKDQPRSLYCWYDIEAWTFFYYLTGSEVSAVESQHLRSARLKHVRIPLEMHDVLQGLVHLWVKEPQNGTPRW
jgi:hypothetical protein